MTIAKLRPGAMEYENLSDIVRLKLVSCEFVGYGGVIYEVIGEPNSVYELMMISALAFGGIAMFERVARADKASRFLYMSFPSF